MDQSDTHVIKLEGRPRPDHPPPIVLCTCGWTYGPSEDLMTLGAMAFAHSTETGHTLRQSHEV